MVAQISLFDYNHSRIKLARGCFRKHVGKVLLHVDVLANILAGSADEISYVLVEFSHEITNNCQNFLIKLELQN